MNNSSFKINQVVYDSENKEYVKITNRICSFCSNPAKINEERDRLSKNLSEKQHSCDDFMVPFEGLAVRAIGFDNDTLLMGFTYREIDPAKISEARDKAADMFTIVFNQSEKVTGKYRFIGQV